MGESTRPVGAITRPVFALLVVTVLAAGCGGATKPASELGRAAGSPGAGETESAPAPASRGGRAKGLRPLPADARRRSARLPLAERVGQLFVVGFEGRNLQSRVFTELRGHGWGGIVIGPQNTRGVSGFSQFAGEAEVAARGARRVPPLVAAVADGRPPRLGSSPAQARSRARIAGKALAAAGVTLTTAPFIDVGIGADAGLIARIAPAAVQGWLKAGVMPAPGHFPGQGSASQDPLAGPSTVALPRRDLAARDLPAFRRALGRAPAVTVSSAAFAAYDPVTPAALVPTIVRDLLRDKLRFGGVAMTDDLSAIVTATGGTPEEAAVAALKAGIDLVYVPDPALRERVYNAVLAAARSGRLPASRVRDAVAHVLELKRRAKVL